MEIKINKSNFEREILNSDKPVLIDFWAPWCGPCRMLAPVLSEVARDYEGKVKVCKVNVDEEPELASAFRVASIPMLAVVKDKKLVNSAVGFMPKSRIAALLA